MHMTPDAKVMLGRSDGPRIAYTSAGGAQVLPARSHSAVHAACCGDAACGAVSTEPRRNRLNEMNEIVQNT
jgi:hypothetical protein